jgi:hypothetical protein
MHVQMERERNGNGGVDHLRRQALNELSEKRNKMMALSSSQTMLTMTRRLVQIWLDDEQQFSDLETLRMRMNRARSYLARKGCNQALGRVVLERAHRSFQEHRACLRANRREAWKLVAGLNVLLTQPAVPRVLRASFLEAETCSWDPRSGLRDGWCA